MGMPERVKRNLGQAQFVDSLLPDAAQIVGTPIVAIGQGEHRIVRRGPAEANFQAMLKGSLAVRPEDFDGGRWQGHRPPTVLGFGRLSFTPARVSSSERSTLSVALSRSTSAHCRPQSSPRRSPVPRKVATIDCRRWPASAGKVTATSAGDSTMTSSVFGAGGRTRLATLRWTSSSSAALAKTVPSRRWHDRPCSDSAACPCDRQT